MMNGYEIMTVHHYHSSQMNAYKLYEMAINLHLLHNEY